MLLVANDGRIAFDIVNGSRGVRLAATRCDCLLGFWEQDAAGSNPVAPTKLLHGRNIGAAHEEQRRRRVTKVTAYGWPGGFSRKYGRSRSRARRTRMGVTNAWRKVRQPRA